MRKIIRSECWIALLLGLLPNIACYAAPVRSDDGRQGELNVTGSFQEAPCQIAMRSAFQDISMENLSPARLKVPGDTGQPQQIVIHMLGCKTEEGNNEALKREATIRFLSSADPDEPSLFLLRGVSGLALRLVDVNGRMVQPGESRTPLFQPATDDLVYWVIPVRTKASLTMGEFYATVDFGMSYE